MLVTIVDQNRFFIESYTGATIGTSIAEIYQSPLTNLSTSQVLKMMSVQENGVQSVTVGDTSVNNNNLMEMAKQFDSRAMIELKSLQPLKYYKARG